MADLQRYQPTGVLFADVPRLDFANLREQARAAQGVEQALDRISDFAFRRAREQAEREGMQWGYQNPVTPAQIKAATEGAELPSLPEAGTAFGDAARKIQAAVLRGDLESQVREQYTQLSAAVDAGMVTDFDEVRRTLNAPVDGFARVLAQVSPEEAARFRASTATAGNAVMQAAYKRLAEQGQRLQIADMDNDLQNGIPNIIARTVESEFDPVMLKERLDVMRQQVNVRSLAISPEYNKTALKVFDEARQKETVAVVSRYLSSSEFAPSNTEALAKLRKNDAGVYSALWTSLSAAQRDQIEGAILKDQSNQYAAQERDKNTRKADNNTSFVNAYREWSNPSTPPKRKAELRQQLLNLADTPEEVDRVLKPAGEGKGDPALFIQLKEEINLGAVTSPYQLLKYVRNGGISRDQFSTLVNRLDDQVNDLPRKASRDKIKRASGVPDMMTGTFDPKDAAFQKRNYLEDKVDEAVSAAKQEQLLLPPEKRKPIDYEGITDRVIKEYDDRQRNDGQKIRAKKMLDAFSRNAEKKGKAIELNERSNINDIRRLNIFDERELAKISEHIETLKRPS